ncbi:hypothetical protein ES708_29186 [subsurface metagenome]
MIFSRPLWLLGAAFGLESMRRGFIGGSALSLFVIKEFGLDKQGAPTLDAMRGYLELEETLLSQIPDFLEFLFTPFTDYHNAAKTYLEILDILVLKQRPLACEAYWKKGE